MSSELPPIIKNALLENGWDKKSYFHFQDEYADQIKKKYRKKDKALPDKFVETLSMFNQMTIKFLNPESNNEESISFDLKYLLNISNETLDREAKKIGVNKVYIIGNYGYYWLLVDETENLYGVFERIVMWYGSTIMEGVENILKGKFLKKNLVP